MLVYRTFQIIVYIFLTHSIKYHPVIIFTYSTIFQFNNKLRNLIQVVNITD